MFQISDDFKRRLSAHIMESLLFATVADSVRDLEVEIHNKIGEFFDKEAQSAT